MTVDDVLLTILGLLFMWTWGSILIMAGSSPDRIGDDFVSRGPIERAIERAVKRATRKTRKSE